MHPGRLSGERDSVRGRQAQPRACLHSTLCGGLRVLGARGVTRHTVACLLRHHQRLVAPMRARAAPLRPDPGSHARERPKPRGACKAAPTPVHTPAHPMHTHTRPHMAWRTKGCAAQWAEKPALVTPLYLMRPTSGTLHTRAAPCRRPADLVLCCHQAVMPPNVILRGSAAGAPKGQNPPRGEWGQIEAPLSARAASVEPALSLSEPLCEHRGGPWEGRAMQACTPACLPMWERGASPLQDGAGGARPACCLLGPTACVVGTNARCCCCRGQATPAPCLAPAGAEELLVMPQRVSRLPSTSVVGGRPSGATQPKRKEEAGSSAAESEDLGGWLCL